jgi:hypothetical protein
MTAAQDEKPEDWLMRKVFMLALLLCSLPVLSFGGAKDDFSLSLSLTVGERGRDSHKEKTTTITLTGGNLVYDEAYNSFRAYRGEPVHKEFKLKGDEIARLKSLIKEQNLLGSSHLNFTPAAGQLTYFELHIKITLKGIVASHDLSGPRSVSNIKDERVYQKAIALLQELYRLIHLRDENINYQAPVN